MKCLNIEFGSRELVHGHLLACGIVKRYTFWYHHGETLDEPSVEMNDDDDEMGEPDEMQGILRDLYHDFNDTRSFDHEEEKQEPNSAAKRFYGLLKDSQHPVYDGCKSSKMSALVKLLHIKTLGRWSNESFTMLLKFMKEELLPNGSNLPDSYYEAKKMIKDLRLSYRKIETFLFMCCIILRMNLMSCLFFKSHKLSLS